MEARMKNLFLTIVDILGIFVPGILLLAGLLLFPGVLTSLSSGNLQADLSHFIEANRISIAVAGSIVAYVLGFLVRLWSIGLLEWITRTKWTKMLQEKVPYLEKPLEKAVGDADFQAALQSLASTYKATDLTPHAPYFHFAKRLVRANNSGLWADAERMEAELRFAAGLCIPFCLFIFDGLFFPKPFGYVLSVISLCGLAAVIARFPSRRVKEVLMDYLLALIVLKYNKAPIAESKSMTQNDDDVSAMTIPNEIVATVKAGVQM